ncbi:MAG: hypothetical protein JWL89_197 [Candidatus Saccharibacteria bacterium]|nr:hypothetical protein [Candidatus Saccharibacteria bacterium]
MTVHEETTIPTEATTITKTSIPYQEFLDSEVLSMSVVEKDDDLAAEVIEQLIPQEAPPLSQEFTPIETLPQQIEFVITPPEQLAFNAEVMDTFERLRTLLAAESESISTAEEPTLTATSEITVDSKPESRFEAFILALPVTKERPTVESIQEVANERSLEETLAQLAVCIAEKTEDMKDSEDAVIIIQLIQEISEELNRLEALAKTETSEQSFLTPEITQKLLQLLRALGYQKPQEALTQFVEKYDFELLVHSVKYLHQLVDDENRPEFLSPKLSTHITASNDESVIQRLGKTIFNFVTLSFGPVLAD